MSASRRVWTPEEILQHLRDAAVDGVAPSTAAWSAEAGVERPSRKSIERAFGSWAAAVSAAGLVSRAADRERRARERRETAYAAKIARDGVRPPSWREVAKKEKESVRLAAEVASGSVVVRTLTSEDLARLEVEREARDRRFAPNLAEQRLGRGAR